VKKLISLLLLFSLSTVADEAVKPMATAVALVYKVEGIYSEVKEDLIRAIEAQGAVVSYTAHADKMLKRTGQSLGIKVAVYDQAEVLLFCKAEISHKLVKADPHSLILCPYPIAIYTLTGEPNKVYLSISKPPSNVGEYQGVHRLLQTIITELITF
jgi:uncharacterized protein (DUF302 family)